MKVRQSVSIFVTIDGHGYSSIAVRDRDFARSAGGKLSAVEGHAVFDDDGMPAGTDGGPGIGFGDRVVADIVQMNIPAIMAKGLIVADVPTGSAAGDKTD